MPDPILDRIASGPPLLLDGSIGARLMQMGLPAGQPPEAWVLSHPEKVEAVHREYVEAGSEVIAACTFGGNRIRLRHAGLEDQFVKINTEAVRLARQAAEGHCWIAADMGPTGEFLQPYGPLAPEEANRVFIEQAELLAEVGIDFFLLETYYDLRETRINLAACLEAAPQIPVAASMTFNHKKRGFFTIMGDEAAESLRLLHEEGAFLVGSNCTLEAEGMHELAKELTMNLRVPLFFQPNAGTPQLTSEGLIYPQDVATFTCYMGEIAKLGARAIGGCCGTNGMYIKEMADFLKANP